MTQPDRRSGSSKNKFGRGASSSSSSQGGAAAAQKGTPKNPLRPNKLLLGSPSPGGSQRSISGSLSSQGGLVPGSGPAWLATLGAEHTGTTQGAGLRRKGGRKGGLKAQMVRALAQQSAAAQTRLGGAGSALQGASPLKQPPPHSLDPDGGASQSQSQGGELSPEMGAPAAGASRSGSASTGRKHQTVAPPPEELVRLQVLRERLEGTTIACTCALLGDLRLQPHSAGGALTQQGVAMQGSTQQGGELQLLPEGRRVILLSSMDAWPMCRPGDVVQVAQPWTYYPEASPEWPVLAGSTLTKGATFGGHLRTNKITHDGAAGAAAMDADSAPAPRTAARRAPGTQKRLILPSGHALGAGVITTSGSNSRL